MEQSWTMYMLDTYILSILLHFLLFSSVQSLSCVWLFVTPWIAARQASLSITNSRSSLRLTSIESVMPSSHLILCCPLLLLPPIPHSIRVFSNESTLRMRWPKYWRFTFSIIPSKEIPGLISFRVDWLDLLVVRGTLKSLLQHYSWKASILWCSAFFTIQLSHPYMTTDLILNIVRYLYIYIERERDLCLYGSLTYDCRLYMKLHWKILYTWSAFSYFLTKTNNKKFIRVVLRNYSLKYEVAFYVHA